jgi:hypothetical protein
MQKQIEQMKIKKQAPGWYYITKDGITYDVALRPDQSLKEWEIKQIVKKEWSEDLEWMFTVATLKNAKLLIANDFDFEKAFGGY